MTAIVAAAILAICHGDQSCMDKVADLYPQSPGEVVHAHESLYPEDVRCAANPN